MNQPYTVNTILKVGIRSEMAKKDSSLPGAPQLSGETHVELTSTVQVSPTENSLRFSRAGGSAVFCGFARALRGSSLAPLRGILLLSPTLSDEKGKYEFRGWNFVERSTMCCGLVLSVLPLGGTPPEGLCQ